MGFLFRFRRSITQLLAALLYNLNFEGFASGTIYQGSLKGVCVPGLNCYSCPGAIAACPIGSLQATLVADDKRLPFYIVGILLAFGAIFGRTICGWLCPFGFIQDLLDKIPFPKIQKGTWSRILSKGKYVVLVGFVLIAPVVLLSTTGIGTPAFCAWLCPAGTLEAGIPLVLANENTRMMLGALFYVKVGALIALIVCCLFVYRPFCRFLCPLGAIYSFFNKFSLLRYKVDESKCTHCDDCLKVCKVDIRTVSDKECIQCGACVTSCGADAISFSLRGMLSNKGKDEQGRDRQKDNQKGDL